MSTRPSKIVCVGRSYADHAKELGNAIPDRPVLFIKPPSALGDLDAGIEWNRDLGSCHYECELSLRIDRTLKNETDPAKALEAVGAVTLGLDLTLRDLQDDLKKKGQPWERAKAYDGACLLSDWVSVEDVVNDWKDVHYTLHVNDALRQKGDTALLIFDVGTLLADISQVFTLEEGDVVMTGTPAGVAALHSGEQLKMTLKGKNQEYIWTTFVK
ncbi:MULTISPECIES: fumarylacetoacetate hydrolase family protein [Acinetobacter]|jgi:2-keto-4-pentenoate hydratase/2-oxohepta-3-ene-1,7-dioic acid hydratase in catechol pathway|uniref:fumarylacetoacetate hydrolase family protein n=1 Tax=Acinetobacter TaxID=469 RepID=UPI000662C424|nr:MULTISPECIES: fumarylacetoacetate hydrolase family protein [Acinetobacter]APX63813.1 fumarylacetoacetate hydrolase protein [Acinetobacter schindleri]KMU99887.1 fumarylacetoacetate hydrolase [Acinetobacter sp. VT 511]MBB4834138.1 2-keto-4-pentenoate hydratase/2-oxohepta-3-ene-1,7-dioic acid hydratase in catechol pathway [Acinetobacter schindleri]OIJ39426.1 fumarylacetoacetate hydrolase [Acinetobacter sp. LCT-H3]WBX38498.1 fumarylacetoacetate hydrolase family protein [Acinetobacter schindleri